MLINCTFELNSLEGEQLKVNGKLATVGSAVSNVLTLSKTKDPMRSYVLAQQFFSGKEIEVNDSDLNFITELVKVSDFVPLITGQLLQVLKKE